MECIRKVPESILRRVDINVIEDALKIKFKNIWLLVEAMTHASKSSSGVSCYKKLAFVGDAVLGNLITKHLFFTYTNLTPGYLTELRAAAVNNENFARVAVKHNLHVHLRHDSPVLEKEIKQFVKIAQDELSKPVFNYFGLGDYKAPKVLADIVESIAGAIFIDSGKDTSVWKPLLHPMVTPETLPIHPVLELRKRCKQHAKGLEYRASSIGNLVTVEVGAAQNPQKLAARNVLADLKEKDVAKSQEKNVEKGKQNNAALKVKKVAKFKEKNDIKGKNNNNASLKEKKVAKSQEKNLEKGKNNAAALKVKKVTKSQDKNDGKGKKNISTLKVKKVTKSQENNDEKGTRMKITHVQDKN